MQFKDRNTYELPCGHTEVDESVLETAEREFREEMGAVDFSMERIYDYSVRMVTREKFLKSLSVLWFLQKLPPE